MSDLQELPEVQQLYKGLRALYAEVDASVANEMWRITEDALAAAEQRGREEEREAIAKFHDHKASECEARHKETMSEMAWFQAGKHRSYAKAIRSRSNG